MIAVGYSGEKKEPVSNWKSLQEIVGYNHWQHRLFKILRNQA
jgi:hypothetical protein